MKNLARRQWGPNLNLKEGMEQAIDWLARARQKNIINKKKSTIYHAYLTKQVHSTENYRPVSTYFKYSAKDTPQIDHARDSLLRLMSVSMKAHFFLANKEKILHEPYVGAIPNLNGPYDLFVLIYPLTNEQAIISSEIDFGKVGLTNEIMADFPVALTSDSFKWFWMKDWYNLKNNADFLNEKVTSGVIVKSDNSPSAIIKELPPLPEKDSKPSAKAVEAKPSTSPPPATENKPHKKFFNPETIKELNEIGTAIDVPWEFKDLLKPLGIEWAPKLKTWYLPHGFDLDSVIEHLEELKKNAKKNK